MKTGRSAREERAHRAPSLACNGTRTRFVRHNDARVEGTAGSRSVSRTPNSIDALVHASEPYDAVLAEPDTDEPRGAADRPKGPKASRGRRQQTDGEAQKHQRQKSEPRQPIRATATYSRRNPPAIPRTTFAETTQGAGINSGTATLKPTRQKPTSDQKTKPQDTSTQLEPEDHKRRSSEARTPDVDIDHA